MLLRANNEHQQKQDGECNDEYFVDPVQRFDRFGWTPERVSPLSAMDRDFDLNNLRKFIL